MMITIGIGWHVKVSHNKFKKRREAKRKEKKMSFQDVGQKSPSGAKTQSEAQGVAAALFQTNTAVATFRRLVDAIGTSKDTPDHRLKLRRARQRILDLLRDASAKLKSVTEADRGNDDDPNRKIQNTKLAKDLQTTLQEFQKLQQLAAERESKFSTPPASITISTPGDQAESSFETGDDDSFLMEHERQELRLLDNDVAFNEAVIEEREQGIEEIQGQIREVNEMFKDLAVLVNEQGVTVDDIEHSIEVSAVSTTQAKVKLTKGSESGNRKTTWCWWMLGVIVIIVLIILLILIL